MPDKPILHPVFPPYTPDPDFVPADRRGPFNVWFDGMLKARHLTRADFAGRVGIDPGHVAHWALDRVPNPASCKTIAKGFGIPTAEVLVAAGHIEQASDLDQRDPTRARLHALIDVMDPEILKPHLAILERTAAAMGMIDD